MPLYYKKPVGRIELRRVWGKQTLFPNNTSYIVTDIALEKISVKFIILHDFYTRIVSRIHRLTSSAYTRTRY